MRSLIRYLKLNSEVIGLIYVLYLIIYKLFSLALIDLRPDINMPLFYLFNCSISTLACLLIDWLVLMMIKDKSREETGDDLAEYSVLSFIIAFIMISLAGLIVYLITSISPFLDFIISWRSLLIIPILGLPLTYADSELKY